MKKTRFCSQKGITELIVLVVMGILAVVLPIATKLVQQNQENRSKAASLGSVCPVIGAKGCCDGNVCMCTEESAALSFWMETQSCTYGCSGQGICNSSCISKGGYCMTSVQCSAIDGSGISGTGGCESSGGTCCNRKTARLENGKLCNSNSDCTSNKCFKSYCIGASWDCNPYGTTGSGCVTGKTCKYSSGIFKCTIADGEDTTGLVTGGAPIVTNTTSCSIIGGICAKFNITTTPVGTTESNFPYGGSTCSVTGYPGTGDIVAGKCGNTDTSLRTQCCSGIAGIDGVCNNNLKNGCSKGVANDSAVADTTTYYKWSCVGSYGGKIVNNCQILRSKVVDGICNNTVRNGCNTGSANDALIADTSTYYKWVCEGTNGGATATNCQKKKSADGTTYELTLTPSSLSLNIGSGSTVTPVLTPARSTEVFAWTSSDTTIAKVFIPNCSDNTKSTILSDKTDYSSKCDTASTSYYMENGTKQCTKCAGTNYAYVQAGSKQGTATITVLASPSGATATLLVTVGGGSGSPSPTVTGTQSVTGINLSPDPLNVKVGESKQITVGFVPAGSTAEYTLSNADANIAEVTSDGKVTGKKAGETEITATVKGTSISDTIKVVVSEDGQTASDASVSFKVAFAGIAPGAECINSYLIPENKLELDVANIPSIDSGKFEDGIQTSFEETNETDSKGNRVFKVTNLSLSKEKFGAVNNINYIRVKGPWHLKRRMCQDNQSSKLPESTVCDIDLKSSNTKVYDFSEYTLLAGDISVDGVINSLDLSYIKTRLEAGGDVECGIDGDLNMDGKVNTFDLNLVKDALTERDDE